MRDDFVVLWLIVASLGKDLQHNRSIRHGLVLSGSRSYSAIQPAALVDHVNLLRYHSRLQRQRIL